MDYSADAFTTLYIVGIPDSATEQTIRDVFSKYGTVELVTILAKRPNYITRTIFVKYSKKEEALTARRELNGTNPFGSDGQNINIKIADKNYKRKREERMRQQDFYMRKPMDRPIDRDPREYPPRRDDYQLPYTPQGENGYQQYDPMYPQPIYQPYQMYYQQQPPYYNTGYSVPQDSNPYNYNYPPQPPPPQQNIQGQQHTLPNPPQHQQNSNVTQQQRQKTADNQNYKPAPTPVDQPRREQQQLPQKDIQGNRE
ncbi:hypothetical protein EIN_095920 [Entamoeba invadens IP1]|uniref:RRM domain-containing protein n=1 Tax=Entamoeba invadens IP1 TaxID=370355 RepID=A0A0A1U0B7_ENTIV|nr:hypothetical protein EIN_095920 [Entamoeba invadens IP1]ELP87335.1 hypothetical protein EIN_095920 [Entamoeba invadens IP1]|eukprot:XP_004254106.1 hypothetical protein EIN_095920 [Entamoeba invadens IP1]